MKVIFRTRLNGRIPDPQDKYRDEITQEATIEVEDEDGLEEDVILKAQERMDEIKAIFYTELARLGGKNYAEV